MSRDYKDYRKTLEIEGPLASCGHCRFTTALDGKFTVEDGLLVWRASPDPLSSRGPGLESCCESSHDGAGAIEFRYIAVEDENLSDEDVAALRETATRAQEEEMRQWEAEEQ